MSTSRPARPDDDHLVWFAFGAAAASRPGGATRILAALVDGHPHRLRSLAERARAAADIVDPDLREEALGLFQRAASDDGDHGREPPVLAELTPRERQVAELVTRGLTNRAIADALGLAEKTVRNYVSAVLEKLDVANRTELAVLLTRRRV